MKKLSILVFIFTMATAAWAVPARRGGIIKTQPDGSEVTIYQHGDEHFHWMTNENGEWLKVDIDGFYRVTEALSAEEIEAKRMAAPKRVAQAASPLNIAPRGLVILVNFQDVKFTTSKAEMDSMLTGENYSRSYSYKYNLRNYKITSEGSARKYFYDSSNGQYNPQFDVVGPVTVSQNVSYYGGNDRNGNDKNPGKMVAEACRLVDDSVDFSLYDNNGDGYVDFVYVIYAGYGEADGGAASTIWPHQYYVSMYEYVRLDNKIIDLYACGNELDNHSKKHTGIGTFCHEFSHVLGLPDMYETTGNGTHKTLGQWDILDYGPYNNDGNTPPTYSAYERFFMGWLEPRLITEPENVTLGELQSSNEALLISATDQHNLVGNNPNPTTFYLLENRQQTGWDEHIPGHGMMLTKVQYNSNKWAKNEVNNKSTSMGVDLIEADGKTPDSSSSGYDGKPGDLFPKGATEYTKIADHPIEIITEEDGVIRFKYKGGVEDPKTAVENINSPQEVIAIYNILGQKQTTTNVAELPHGTYVVVTSAGNHKIVR
ncbi:MAG: M6 family metalloprotease domain-containing protein [Paludibacteraceae bacterium]|nr:M6 family metalloprotease domain-containing protein [Paludibacteraceae bacterium]